VWERALTAGRVERERATVRRQLVVHARSGKENTQLAERRGEVKELAQTAAILRNCDTTQVEHARSADLPTQELRLVASRFECRGQSQKAFSG